MVQSEVKLEFVRRYCTPRNGWRVFVDIDRLGEGRTEVESNADVRKRQAAMAETAGIVRTALEELGVTVGTVPDGLDDWYEKVGLWRHPGDRDIVAFHRASKTFLVAEVIGQFPAQPEQRLGKAIGEIIAARTIWSLRSWNHPCLLVVHGDDMAGHLAKANALARIGVSGLALARDEADDRWLFGEPLAVVKRDAT
jgi:hypothetical protein